MDAAKLSRMIRKASREQLETFAETMIQQLFNDGGEINLDKEMDCADFVCEASNDAQAIFEISEFMDKERLKDERVSKKLASGKV